MMNTRHIVKRLAKLGLIVGGGACVVAYAYPKLKARNIATATEIEKEYAWTPLPTRAQMLQSMEKEEFDVLVIGGGATGCGVALDSVSRGINNAVFDACSII